VSVLAALVGCTRSDRLVLEETWTFGSEEAPRIDDGDVVFAAVGDMGDANRMQAAVAEGVQRACDDRCDFVLLLGDNRYEAGVATTTDEAALECIVESYPTRFKYLVLGNHDYSPVTPKLERARAELAWVRSTTGRRVGARGAHHFYAFEAGPVRLFALDTNYLVRGRINARYRDIVESMGWLEKRDDGWTVVFGHHPMMSTGSHGSAGEFREGRFKLWDGRFFRHFMRQHVLGRADVYVSGHDHLLEFFPRILGTETAQVVSGSGARCRGKGHDAETEPWLEHYGHGFALVNATPERLTVRYYDYDGDIIWGVTRTHDGEWRPLAGFDTRQLSERNLCDVEAATVRERRNPERGCFSER
jgi:hypothetical protein